MLEQGEKAQYSSHISTCQQLLEENLQDSNTRTKIHTPKHSLFAHVICSSCQEELKNVLKCEKHYIFSGSSSARLHKKYCTKSPTDLQSNIHFWNFMTFLSVVNTENLLLMFPTNRYTSILFLVFSVNWHSSIWWIISCTMPFLIPHSFLKWFVIWKQKY